MKRLLICPMLLAVGLCLSAQNLYVQPLGGGAQVEFSLAEKPKIVFGQHAFSVETNAATQTFQLDDVQNLSFKSNAPTSVAADFENGKIFIYPNPVKDELEVSLQIPAKGLTYRIFDLSGKQLYANPIHSETTKIQMQNFRAGVYVLNIEQGGQFIQSFKIIKH